MDIVVVSICALLAAGLTFFTGFGLGTILLPLFTLFFTVEMAVVATAVLHLANNCLKAALVWKDANTFCNSSFRTISSHSVRTRFDFCRILSCPTVLAVGWRQVLMTKMFRRQKLLLPIPCRSQEQLPAHRSLLRK